MHFGIVMTVKGAYDYKKAEDSAVVLADAHPFLRSVIAAEGSSDKLFYSIGNASRIEIKEMSSSSAMEDFAAISGQSWNVFEHGLLKIFLYPNVSEDGSFMALFAMHHLLGDGRAALQLALEFAELYSDGKKPCYAEEHLMKSVDDLPPDSALAGMGKILVNSANRKWAKENKRVDYDEYLKFEREFSAAHPIGYEFTGVDTNIVAQMKILCKSNGFSVNDLLMARLFIASKAPKIIIAADIRDKVGCYNKGAMGNYATALGVMRKSKSNDETELARDVNKCVKKSLDSNRALMTVIACYFAMTPTLIDAAAISALGGFESEPGRFVGGAMFGFEKREGLSITNLGSAECSAVTSAMFIPPASPAAMQTVGVLTVNGKMNLCSSYYKDKLDSEEVKARLKRMSESDT